MKRSPNPNVPEEVRRAIQRGNRTSDTHATEIAALDAAISSLQGDIAVLDAEVFALQGDVVVIDGRLDALEALTEAYSAEADSTTAIGSPLYMKGTGHVDSAVATSASTQKVIGLATQAKAAGLAVSYTSDGRITKADWTEITGVTALTPGANYYLAGEVPAYDPPSYSNVGGTGNRTAIITVTASPPLNPTSDAPMLVNGVTGYEVSPYWYPPPITNAWIQFDFGIAAYKLITEAKWYQAKAGVLGVAKWQGSNNGTSWTDIGGSFDIGTTATQIQTSMSVNVSGYRYYRLFCISGAGDISNRLREVEFKITNAPIPPAPGMLTATSPGAAGSYVVKVGRAVSTTTLDIEIQQSIML